MSMRVVCLVAASVLFRPASGQLFELDPSYGSNGMVYHDAAEPALYALAKTLLVLPDGRTIGVFTTGQDSTQVRRFLTDGGTDLAFGIQGSMLVTTRLTGHVFTLAGMAVAPDGSLFIAGSRLTSATGITTVELIHLTADGAFDMNFGNAGVASYSVPNYSSFRTMTIQPDGKVLVAGSSGPGIIIVRVQPDGQLDQGFAENGVGYYTKAGSLVRPNNVRVGANGGIHVVGYLSSGMDATGLMACKVTSDGSLDTQYANGGFFIHDHTPNNFRMETLKDCVPGPDGSLLAAGQIALENVRERFCAVKLRPDGSLDPAFGDGGIVLAGTADEDRNVLENVIMDPRGFYVLFGILTPPQSIYRSLFLCIDLAGNPIPDVNGEIFQNHLSPEPAQYNRRLVADNAGGFILALAYFNLPVGDQSLTRLVLASPITLTTAETAVSKVNVWPNPATDRINVRCDRAFGADATIVLTDATGRLIPMPSQRTSRWTNERTLELELPPRIADGSYSIRIRDAHEQAVATFVIKR